MYLVSKAEALEALAIVNSHPAVKEAGIPPAKAQRLADANFNRDGLPTDWWYLVWPNRYHEPVGAVLPFLRAAPVFWASRFLSAYFSHVAGLLPGQPGELNPGTEEGIKFKD
jgi:hypothetical protein